MLKKDLILRNPLRFLGGESEEILPDGGFGAVMARAGVGKTAFLVQIALNTQLLEQNILHISLDDPVKKIDLWYQEVFRLLARQYNVEQIDRLWESVRPHRFIMTFRVEGFSVPILEERLTNLTEQDIFAPRLVIIDGLPFDETVREPLTALKSFARANGLHVWFAVQTHRNGPVGEDGIPAPLAPVADLFEVAVQLQPEGKEIYVKALKGAEGTDHPEILLDPSTMLIKDRAGKES